MIWLEVANEERQIIGFPLTLFGTISLIMQQISNSLGTVSPLISPTSWKRDSLTGVHELVTGYKVSRTDHRAPYNFLGNSSLLIQLIS